MARLTREQFERLYSSIPDAFDLSGFDQMLWLGLGRRREDISLGGNLRAIILDVIRTAENEGWTGDLLDALASERLGLSGLHRAAWARSVPPCGSRSNRVASEPCSLSGPFHKYGDVFSGHGLTRAR